MQKNILITGATDGIGLLTAEMLVSQGHQVLLHGRNPGKLKAIENNLSELSGTGCVASYMADLSRMDEVEKLAKTVAEQHSKLDVLINNAGVLKTLTPVTQEGLDVRFVVNTLAPYLLTQQLMPLLNTDGRVINLSSAAQSPVNLQALAKAMPMSDMEAYAQSKLAITMWSRQMGLALKDTGPMIVAINPGSLLGTKMVKEGFDMDGKDIGIGADILIRAALSDEFAKASGDYFDNDSGQFAPPHADALDTKKCADVVHTIETILNKLA